MKNDILKGCKPTDSKIRQWVRSVVLATAIIISSLNNAEAQTNDSLATNKYNTIKTTVYNGTSNNIDSIYKVINKVKKSIWDQSTQVRQLNPKFEIQNGFDASFVHRTNLLQAASDWLNHTNGISVNGRSGCNSCDTTIEHHLQLDTSYGGNLGHSINSKNYTSVTSSTTINGTFNWIVTESHEGLHRHNIDHTYGKMFILNVNIGTTSPNWITTANRRTTMLGNQVERVATNDSIYSTANEDGYILFEINPGAKIYPARAHKKDLMNGGKETLPKFAANVFAHPARVHPDTIPTVDEISTKKPAISFNGNLLSITNDTIFNAVNNDISVKYEYFIGHKDSINKSNPDHQQIDFDNLSKNVGKKLDQTVDVTKYGLTPENTAVWVYAIEQNGLSLVDTIYIDNTPPVAKCKAATIYIGMNGETKLIVSDIDDGSTDNVGIVRYEISDTAFQCIDVGNKTVQLKVFDLRGNMDSCSSIVTILDTIKPILATRNKMAYLPASGIYVIDKASLILATNDNCAVKDTLISPARLNCTHTGINTITITITITDSSGNLTVGTAIINFSDNTKPTGTIDAADTVYLDASGNGATSKIKLNASATDNCGLTYDSLSQKDFDCTNLGINKINYYFADNSGNKGSVSSIITVLDTIKPTGTINVTDTIYLDTSGNGATSKAKLNASATDNCTLSSDSLSKRHFTCSDLGLNTIQYIYTDNSGNKDSVANITTVLDTMKPTGTINATDTIYLDASGNGATSKAKLNASATDNCTLSSDYLSKRHFTCSDLGLNTIQYIYTDNSGNKDSVSSIITVLNKNKPTIIPRKKIVVDLHRTGTANITGSQADSLSSAVCGTSALSLSQSTFTSTGTYSVYLKGVDGQGNVDSTQFVVAVTDSTVGINEVGIKRLKLYPNPSNGIVTIGGVAAIQRIVIWDVAGKIMPVLWVNNSPQINISMYKSGLYFIKVQDKKGMLWFGKVVKE